VAWSGLPSAFLVGEVHESHNGTQGWASCGFDYAKSVDLFWIDPHFNFNLSAILGTAGIASVAIGFAAKTSLSNLISGVFLLWERPFQVGDLVQVQQSNILGYVLSIDLLSVKIRTKDNLFVRIPNENLVAGELTNISRFPIRRYSLAVTVAYDTDLKRMEALLIEIAMANSCCLDDPLPTVTFEGMGDSGLDYTLHVWVERERYDEIRNSLVADVMERLPREGIEIPYTRYEVELIGKKD
jgi:small-conductance mechanosensitive channel